MAGESLIVDECLGEKCEVLLGLVESWIKFGFSLTVLGCQWPSVVSCICT